MVPSTVAIYQGYIKSSSSEGTVAIEFYIKKRKWELKKKEKAENCRILRLVDLLLREKRLAVDKENTTTRYLTAARKKYIITTARLEQ